VSTWTANVPPSTPQEMMGFGFLLGGSLFAAVNGGNVLDQDRRVDGMVNVLWSMYNTSRRLGSCPVRVMPRSWQSWVSLARIAQSRPGRICRL